MHMFERIKKKEEEEEEDSKTHVTRKRIERIQICSVC